MNIEEVIVVEGKCDTVAVKRALQADTIETNGSAVNAETIERIKQAHKTRGVIVFTDPDFPGRRIRAIIEEQVPGVKHAFLTKKETIAKNGSGLGIEHASDEAIRQALAAVYTVSTHIIEEIPLVWLLEARLIGHADSKKRRDRLSELLSIGQVNGKGLKKRLEMFRVTLQQLDEAVVIVDKEEMNENV